MPPKTHIHADYVSGSRELANATGANYFTSAMKVMLIGKYAYANQDNIILVKKQRYVDGSAILKSKYSTLPATLPKHISFMITDTAGANFANWRIHWRFHLCRRCGVVPILLEEAAGLVGTKEVGARAQFASVETFLKHCPIILQIWPGAWGGKCLR